MSPPNCQSVAQISAELGIHVDTIYNWRMSWRLQVEVVLTSEKDPEGWGQGLLEVCLSSPGSVDALTVLCAGTALDSWLSSPPPRLLLQAI